LVSPAHSRRDSSSRNDAARSGTVNKRVYPEAARWTEAAIKIRIAAYFDKRFLWEFVTNVIDLVLRLPEHALQSRSVRFAVEGANPAVLLSSIDQFDPGVISLGKAATIWP
jgi:hypothetical protein